MITALYQKLLLEEDFRENFLKGSGTMTINIHTEEENSEEDDLVMFAVENLQAQDLIDMCGRAR